MQFRTWLESTDFKAGDVIQVPAIAYPVPITLRILKIEDGKVYATDSEESTYARVVMPVESLPHFIDDLSGVVKAPRTGDPAVDAVLDGKAQLKGKGNDGLLFVYGDEAIKVSTTVPFHPVNPGHRSPQDAKDRIRKECETARDLQRQGVPGILPCRYIDSGEKGFLVRPQVEPIELLGPMSPEEIIKALHGAGYTFGDEIQLGRRAGKVWLYDLGTAKKSAKVSDIDHDFHYLSMLHSRRNQRFRRWDEDFFQKFVEELEWYVAAGDDEAKKARALRRVMRAAQEAKEAHPDRAEEVDWYLSGLGQ